MLSYPDSFPLEFDSEKKPLSGRKITSINTVKSIGCHHYFPFYTY